MEINKYDGDNFSNSRSRDSSSRKIIDTFEPLAGQKISSEEIEEIFLNLRGFAQTLYKMKMKMEVCLNE